ncbi:MAG: metalloregulator ArsR/SmtB family transcription factor [Immundisolibacteraceae bacterium]|nr:metalloregulator ArsR/SmtB family transcription factor [Immundisolibacteraceae bacterium]
MDEYNADSGIDRAFRALADPTRRAILSQLVAAPSRVTEIAAPHAISLNAVSKHLQMLERAGLVERHRRGREHWFSFNHQPLQRAQGWVTETLEFWNSQLDNLEDYLEAQEKVSD